MKLLVVACVVLTAFAGINAGGQIEHEGEPCEGPTPFEAFYFDRESKLCISFTAEGCQSNLTRFIDSEVCEKFCNNRTNRKPSDFEVPTNASSKDICSLPKDEGYHCDELTPYEVFYSNVTLQFCENFVHKGCGGNANRFKGMSDCINTCLMN